MEINSLPIELLKKIIKSASEGTGFWTSISAWNSGMRQAPGLQFQPETLEWLLDFNFGLELWNGMGFWTSILAWNSTMAPGLQFWPGTLEWMGSWTSISTWNSRMKRGFLNNNMNCKLNGRRQKILNEYLLL
ncbi:hypothetical protein C1646_764095 [Rhizophagus diaphanus]|nr:hypothetical protein C1646_764095 [Rhizophagus diaphanus] [Rhizophagus sp. MUCL 43196]